MDHASIKILIDSDPANAAKTDQQVLDWLHADATINKPINSRQLLRWSASNNRLVNINSAISTGQVEIRSVAQAAMLMVSRPDTELDLDDSGHIGLLDVLVSASVIDSTDKDDLVTLAETTVKRYTTINIGRPKLGDVVAARSL
jgi:hypothetical protein